MTIIKRSDVQLLKDITIQDVIDDDFLAEKSPVVSYVGSPEVRPLDANEIDSS